MSEQYNYRIITQEEKEKSSWFWHALGNFLGSALVLYLASSVLMGIAFLIFIIKLINKI